MMTLIIITYSFVPSHEVIVQPFSSKFSRTALLSFSQTYSKHIENPEEGKPFRVTAIKKEGKPLYSRKGRFVTLRANEKYTFNVTSLDNDFMQEAISNPSFSFEIYNEKFSVELEKMEIYDEERITALIPDDRLIRIDFLTPTLLQPPRPSFKRKKNRYVIFPYVPLLMSSIVSHWNKNMERKITNVLGLRTLYYLKEVDYRLFPITVKYDKGFVRGFTGWCLFSLEAKRNSKLRNNILTLLSYANFVGVGKSRAIGFGEIRVRSADQGRKEKSNSEAQQT
ncbi:CRISPR-associated endoribonuclease Cas6 [Candidatus Acidianus copahuensis]|uniref:CRISPR-associated endoribonuclease Cas6 n=1 Tax=Candidatus Acidianus copahuensis TaxID=1160895 RepID=UPI000B0C7FAC|nr:CRISPR-associated endoribonuclease Cas6 [Candidatus Acidianus copahuensis]